MGRTENKKMRGRLFSKFKNPWTLLVFGAIALMIAGCANDDQIKADLNDLRNQSYSLQKQVDSMQANVQNSQKKLSSTNETELHNIRTSQAGVVDQLSNLQSDLNSLRGSFEEQKHLNQQFFSDQSHQSAGLAERIDQQQKMIDSQGNRIVQLENMLQAQAEQLKAWQAAQKEASTIKKEDQEEEAQTPQAVYDKAYALYQNGQNDDARNAFAAFLKKFPEDPLSGNAQFWIGETYFKQKDYDQAILAYEKVVKQYPKSSKAPNALLQQGISFMKKNGPDDKKVAMALFNQVIEKYPDSPEAKTAKSLLNTKDAPSKKSKKKKRHRRKY